MEGVYEFRERFINEALSKCESKKFFLTDWERNFIIDIARIHRKTGKGLTNHQYNKLQLIAANLDRTLSEVIKQDYPYPIYER